MAARVAVHMGYILDRLGFALAVIPIVEAVVLIATGIDSRLCATVSLLSVLLAGLVSAGLASHGLAAELERSEVQLYLAEGLTRLEYIASWLLALTLYPAFASATPFLLAALLAKPLDSLYTIAWGAATSAILYGSVAVMYAVATGKPGASNALALVHILAAPIAVAAAARLAGLGWASTFIALAPFNPLAGYAAAVVAHLDIPLDAVTAASLASTALYSTIAYIAFKRREV